MLALSERVFSFSSRTIDDCIAILKHAPSLSPDTPDVHVALGMIDGLCNTPMAAQVANELLDSLQRDGRLQQLRNLLAEAEHCNERTQAKAALKADDIADWLHPDTNGRYEKMIGAELTLIQKHYPLDKEKSWKCIFVGCGACR